MAFPSSQSSRRLSCDLDSIDESVACVADFRPSSNRLDATVRNQYRSRAFLARDVHVISGEIIMRVLFGIILGVALTVGVAFVSDSWTTRSATNTGSGSAVAEHRPMVNWEVVGDNMRIAQERIRQGLTKLSHKVAS